MHIRVLELNAGKEKLNSPSSILRDCNLAYRSLTFQTLSNKPYRTIST